MTIATTASVKSWAGNGSTTLFNFPYEYRASGDLKVVLVSSANVAVTKTINTHYTVSGTSDAHGGYTSANVTMVTAPASGEVLVIYRSPSTVQESNPESDGDPLYAIHNQLDLVTYILQHYANRAVQLPIGSLDSVSPVLPDWPDDDGYTYYLAPNSTRTSLAWMTGLASSASVSSAWSTVIGQGTLALGLSAAGLGAEDSPTFAGLTLNGRQNQSVANAVYDQSGNSTAFMWNLSSGSTVTIAANHNLYPAYWGETVSPGSGSGVAFINSNIVLDASSSSAASGYNFLGSVTTAGSATAKGTNTRAIGTGSGNGTIVGGAFGLTPGANTGTAWGVQVGLNTTARKADQAFHVSADTGGATLDYGFVLADGVVVSVAGYLMFGESGAGRYLWLVDDTGANTRFEVSATTGAVESASSIKSKSASAGIGYSTGAGGTVTQGTSRTTGVQVDKVCGAITLVSAAGSATPASFTVTNSAVAANDVVQVSQKSGTDKYIVLVTAVAAGSFQITFYTTGGTTVEQPVFNFAVIKAVVA